MIDVVPMLRFGQLFDFCLANPNDVMTIVLSHPNRRDVKYEYMYNTPQVFKRYQRFGERCWQVHPEELSLRGVMNQAFGMFVDFEKIRVNCWSGRVRWFKLQATNRYILASYSKRHAYVNDLLMRVGLPFDVTDKITDEYVVDDIVRRMNSVLSKLAHK